MRSEFPPAKVFCDFDGTITLIDATDAVLEEFALPAWREWEARWVAGEISSRTCLTRQVELSGRIPTPSPASPNACRPTWASSIWNSSVPSEGTGAAVPQDFKRKRCSGE